jgi:hypothetical protein
MNDSENPAPSLAQSFLNTAKKSAATYFNFSSAKNRIVSTLSPLLLLIPGVGIPLAAGIGVGAGTLAKVEEYLAKTIDSNEYIDPHAIADIIINDAKEEVPGLLMKAKLPDIKLG